MRTKKEVEPSPALMKALRDLDAVPVASRVVIHEDMEALREQNAALKRTVEDLAHALRKANARLEALKDWEIKGRGRRAVDEAAASIRRVLDRHGLLRDVDRPEMTQVFREEPAAVDRCACGLLLNEHSDSLVECDGDPRRPGAGRTSEVYSRPRYPTKDTVQCPGCGARGDDPCAYDCEDRR